MTPSELEDLLHGREITQVLDIKTLVVDTVRDMSVHELLEMFRQQLPKLPADKVREYLFMTRD